MSLGKEGIPLPKVLEISTLLIRVETVALGEILHQHLDPQSKCPGQVNFIFRKKDSTGWFLPGPGHCEECHRSIPIPLSPEEIDDFVTRKARVQKSSVLNTK